MLFADQVISTLMTITISLKSQHNSQRILIRQQISMLSKITIRS